MNSFQDKSRIRTCDAALFSCVNLCRGGTFQAVSPVGEDLAAAHQTSQRRAGAQVQPQEQARCPALPLPEEQARRLLCPHPAGKHAADSSAGEVNHEQGSGFLQGWASVMEKQFGDSESCDSCMASDASDALQLRTCAAAAGSGGGGDRERGSAL